MQDQVQLWTMSTLKWVFRMLRISYDCHGMPFLRISGMEDHWDTMWVTNDWSRREGEGRGGQHSFTRVINGWSRKEGRGGRSNPKEGVCPEGMKSVKHFILCVSHGASSKLEWYYCSTLLHLKLQLMINEVACAAYPWSGVSGIFRLSFPSA